MRLSNISSRDANDSMSTNTSSGAKGSRVRDWDFFWARRHAFQLGALVTESPHPRTVGLAALTRGSRAELEAAYAALRDVDDAALERLAHYQREWCELRDVLRDVLCAPLGESNVAANVDRAECVSGGPGEKGRGGGRVFLGGCGATGRLSLLLEKVWRERAPEQLRERVVGFMAGGDCALVKSIEGFEGSISSNADLMNYVRELSK